jgi:hypothetical protein
VVVAYPLSCQSYLYIFAYNLILHSDWKCHFVFRHFNTSLHATTLQTLTAESTFLPFVIYSYLLYDSTGTANFLYFMRISSSFTFTSYYAASG